MTVPVTSGIDGIPAEITTFVVHVPQTSLTQPVHCFPAAGGTVLLAVAARPGSTVEMEASGDPRAAVDPLVHLSVAAPAGAAPAQVLRFQRHGEPPLRLCAGGAATRSVAERICPTGDDQLAEVVLIDGVEAVLLRPAHLMSSALLQ